MKLYPNAQLLSMFEHYISAMPTPDEPQLLYAPIKYGLEEGGKRIRPTLLMLAYNLYAEDVERALRFALCTAYTRTISSAALTDKSLYGVHVCTP